MTKSIQNLFIYKHNLFQNKTFCSDPLSQVLCVVLQLQRKTLILFVRKMLIGIEFKEV